MRVQWLVILTILAVSPTQADTLGAKMGLQFWQSDTQGYVGEATDATVDWQDTEGTNFRVYANIEHPLLFIPNVKVAYSRFDFDQQTILAQTYRLGGQVYSVGSTLDIAGEYEILDLVSYYEIIDRDILSFDVGLNFRLQDTEYQVDNFSSLLGSTANVSALVPMVYLKLGSALPLMGLSSYIEVQAGEDNHDYEAAIGYQFIESPAMNIGLFIGMKDQRVSYQFQDGIYGNAEWESVFVALEAHF